MKLALTLTAGLALAGCAVEYAQTDLRSLTRADRTSFRDATDVTVVMYPVPAPTYNGYVDQRSIEIRDQTGAARQQLLEVVEDDQRACS